MPEVNPTTLPRTNSSLEKQDDPIQPAFCPYYRKGDQLRAKHQRSNMASGRRFEFWALDLLPLSPGSSVLDAGCGWGRFTWPLVETRALAPANITPCDSSLGMLQTAAQEAAGRGHRLQFAAAEIQSLPFPSAGFDGAMANHVLYHLPDIPAGIRELARVLKKTGWLLATTNSDEVSVPVLEYHYAALDELGVNYVSETRSPFSMENGARLLEASFKNVRRVYFEDETLYYSADEFLASYMTIGRYRNLIARDDINLEIKELLPLLVRKRAQNAIHEHDVLRSPVRMGAFVCSTPFF